jgi:YD repeat-containing protein
VLLRGEVRLLTLIGPPGIGKTRLGIEVTRDVHAAFSDGVSFVALASLGDPSLVIATIAQTLGVKESAGQPLLDQLNAALQAQRRLLLLDNFEHLLAAAALTDLCTLAGATELSRFQYTLNRAGQRTQVSETLNGQIRSISYGYDGVQRLTSAAESPGAAYTYAYDLAGWLTYDSSKRC